MSLHDDLDEVSEDAQALAAELVDLGLQPAEDITFMVHVMRDGGHVTTYTQHAPTMYVAITRAHSEHRKTWGYRGRVIFAQDMSFG